MRRRSSADRLEREPSGRTSYTPLLSCWREGREGGWEGGRGGRGGREDGREGGSAGRNFVFSNLQGFLADANHSQLSIEFDILVHVLWSDRLRGTTRQQLIALTTLLWPQGDLRE